VAEGFRGLFERCFDVRAETLSSRISDPAEYLQCLKETTLPEVLCLIEGQEGLWPAIMVESRRAAGFLVEDTFARFIETGFQRPGDTFAEC